ncbi:TMV resistance protein N [Morella rubra]|uniref:TMV resistance protein N n=1 Tax=Morella rubra TaxID=262757 RepID=A0A6A1UKJ9_9ROSI|nr:TMV resistance protein N [Morella rubra]
MKFCRCKSLTKFPDLSKTPNLKELTLCHCENLVEVHHSVGLLDKLSYLSLHGCPNLRSFPRSLKLRSLEHLDLKGCSSLQNFPEIECKMEYLTTIYLGYSGIEELPSSIGNVTALQVLDLDCCKNLLHLPSTIIQLQHLEELCLKDCSRLRLMELGDDRQSAASIMSTREDEISSRRELVSLQPPTKSSISNGCSPVVFPLVQKLKLTNWHLAESDFFATCNCSSTLTELNLSGSDVVSLPTCMKIFVQLRFLLLMDCKELQEILELTPNIVSVIATRCTSLESFPEVSKKFQFNTSELPALGWIDLSGCHKMVVDVENHMANPLLCKGHLKDYKGLITFPGHQIPVWFSHRKEMSSKCTYCEIKIDGLLHLDEIVGIALCLVIGPIPEINRRYGYTTLLASIIISNDIELDYDITDDHDLCLVDSDVVCLQYLTLESFKIKGEDLGDTLQVEFYGTGSMEFKSCGVHLIRKHVEDVKDHLGMLHEDADHDHLDVPDEEIENSADLILDGIQLSESCHDGDDRNSEANWYPQDTSHPSTLGIKSLDTQGTILDPLSHQEVKDPKEDLDLDRRLGCLSAIFCFLCCLPAFLAIKR